MKKHILFVITNLSTGGIIRSLQNFLNCYDTTKYNIYVFAMVHQGIYCDKLNNCTLLPKNKVLHATLARFDRCQGFEKIKCIFAKLINKATRYRFQERIFIRVGDGLIRNNKYDAVIAFSEGVPTAFVASMNHPNKIGWIHCDYISYLKLNNGKQEKDIYNKFQSVVCVSEFTRKSFLSCFPEMGKKTSTIHNILDERMMKQLSTKSIEETLDENQFNIVSIGRIDPIKRLSIIPELAKKIIDAGCKICWYVIGPTGTDAELFLFQKNIKQYHVEEIVVALGEKANPYPYISKANLLVNTSISEACPYVINEAKVLHTPVVCSDFGSAPEFIQNGENGFVVSIDNMADTIISLIQDKEKLNTLKWNLSHFHYDNERILAQINSLI